MQVGTKLFKAADWVLFSAALALLRFTQFPAIVAERGAPVISDEVVGRPAGDRFAIVVKYFGRRWNSGEVALLQSLRAEGVNTIVVFNRTPTAEEIELARGHVHRILVRRNVGRDFGAYRSAVLNLQRSDVRPSRLLFFNDSVFLLPGRKLADMVSRLVHATWDVVGAFENHASAHHVGSFAFSVSGAVYDSAEFRRFWRRYRPYNIRPHAIARGEMGLTRTYRKERFGVDILYSLDKIGGELAARTLNDDLALLRVLPRRPRQRLGDLLRQPFSLAGGLDGDTDLPSRRDGALPTLRDLSRVRRRPADAGGAVPALVKGALIDAVLDLVGSGSQAHQAFGLYRRLFGVPVVKKDLLRHDVYDEHDMTELLDDVEESYRREIVRELIARQRPISLGWVRNYLGRRGFV